MRRITPVLMLVATLIAPTTARAAILSFEFFGIAGPGSTINLGGGAVDVSGLEFTASGQTINDVDLFNGGVAGDGIGFFAATATYDFGAFGAFTTDVGADFYGQNCGGAAAVTCALLSDVGAIVGFRMDFAPAVPGNPDFGIPLGTQAATSFQINTRTQTNSAGHSLTLASGGSIRSATVTATDVPEPASLLLMGAGTLIAARRLRARRQR
jgi:hypothetical protein